MTATKDQIGLTDAVRATIETTPTAPVAPCSQCGSETRPAEPIMSEPDTSQRICSSRACRHVASGIEEVPRITSPADPHGKLDKRPHFPCPGVGTRKDKKGNPLPGVCGKETKPHGGHRVVIEKRRICSNPACRHVMSLS